MSEHINIPSNPADRKKVQDALNEMRNCLQRIEDEKSAMTDITGMLKEEYEMPPKLVRALSKAMLKHNFAEVQADYENFEAAYEIFVEGKKTD